MAINQKSCEPLDFESVFLKLLADMDGLFHHLGNGRAKEKLLRYQTLIAAGGYIGLRAKEFLSLCWSDIIDKNNNEVFQFKTKTKRNVYFAPSFIKMVDRNYKLIDPVNIHHLVLHKQDNPKIPVSTNQFNQSFGRYLSKFKVNTPTPSSHTLRKTHMIHAWHLLGNDERAYLTVGKMMGYKSKDQIMDYLGHTQRDIKAAVLKFK